MSGKNVVAVALRRYCTYINDKTPIGGLPRDLIRRADAWMAALRERHPRL